MTAHDPKLSREQWAELQPLFVGAAQAVIVDAWAHEEIDGDRAIALLIELGLIEVPNG